MDKTKRSLLNIIKMVTVKEIFTYDIVMSPGFHCATISVNITSDAELQRKKMQSRLEKIDELLRVD
jgi:hypothetical protein